MKITSELDVARAAVKNWKRLWSEEGTARGRAEVEVQRLKKLCADRPNMHEGDTFLEWIDKVDAAGREEW